ncbi:hypothetical protein NE237_000251 [Protea cynaroides]|uniref:Uncharacterized protein n=1 Tax=Protea cynaroides TaxID=273540 RepID=A0A9Q0QWZ2_9MAGN|nr:hypothetical protein NE237_000251 [Protea cynaroides]
MVSPFESKKRFRPFQIFQTTTNNPASHIGPSHITRALLLHREKSNSKESKPLQDNWKQSRNLVHTVLATLHWKKKIYDGTFGFFSFEYRKVYWINIKGHYPAKHCVGSCESWLVLSSPFLPLNLFSTELNICTLGDARWNVMELGHEHFLGSLVYFKNQIYTLSTYGELWIISLSGPKLRLLYVKFVF